MLKKTALFILMPSLLTSCILADAQTVTVPANWLDKLGKLTQMGCQFVPVAADVAIFFEVTGATKVKQTASVICAAVQKKKTEITAAEANETAMSAPLGTDIKPYKLPVGTKITVVIDGKTISGLLTR